MLRSSLLFLTAVAALVQAQSPPPHSVFYRDEVHVIRLTFTQTDWWDQLTKNYSENEDDVPYIEANLSWGPWQFDRIGVRFKGNSSYRGATTQKKPFRLKLNEFVKGQKIEGMASFNLNNGWNDPSMMRDRLYFDLAGAAGFVGPRANYAALYINGKFWGLYGLGEVVNGDFLENWYGKQESSGNLYKAELPAALEDRGDDPAAYKTMFEKKSNETADDWSDIANLIAVLNRTPVEELPAKLEPLLDIDSVLCALALDNLTVNLDSYAGMGQNYYLYRRPSDRRFVWILWDPSLAFGGLPLGLTTAQMKELALDWTVTANAQTPPGGGGGFPGGGPGGGGVPGGVTTRVLATKLWQVPKYRARYDELYRWFVNDVAHPDQLVQRARDLQAMLRPYVEQDTQKLTTLEQFDRAIDQDQTVTTGPGGGLPGGPGGFPGGPGFPGGGGPGGGGAPGLDPFIRARVQSAATQLSNR